MRTEALPPITDVFPRSVIKQLQLHGWNWRSAGAVFGLGFGIICPLVASVLTAVSWVTGPHWHGFFIQRYDTVLFFLTVPLLIFGAHCLDLLDEKNKRTKNVISKVQ